MAHLIRTARSRLRDTPSEERALRPRDVPGTLLNIALLNLSASDEILRTGAYNLFNDLGKFYDYDMFQGVRKVTGGSIRSQLGCALTASWHDITCQLPCLCS